VNLIEAKVIAREGAGLRLQSEMIRFPILAAQRSDAKIGDPVTLALRPEKMKIGLERPAVAAENCIEGVVWDIAYLGDLSIYRVRLENGVLLMAAKPNLTRPMERPISWDDKVYLSWEPDAGVVLTR
jgi:putrescine transport system ATP-binding protein